MEKRRLWGDRLAAFQYIKEAYKENGERLFIRARMKGKGIDFRLCNRKKFSVMRAIRP